VPSVGLQGVSQTHWTGTRRTPVTQGPVACLGRQRPATRPCPSLTVRAVSLAHLTKTRIIMQCREAIACLTLQRGRGADLDVRRDTPRVDSTLEPRISISGPLPFCDGTHLSCLTQERQSGVRHGSHGPGKPTASHQRAMACTNIFRRFLWKLSADARTITRSHASPLRSVPCGREPPIGNGGQRCPCPSRT